MAAQLKNGVRFPAAQKLGAEVFAQFVATCQNPPAPSEALKSRLALAGKKKL